MKEAPTVPGLPAKRLRELRARAHSLKPVVWVSQNGMSEGALREVDRALTAHELIKIHAAIDDRRAREALLATLCEALSAEPVQVIGKTLIAFRQRPQDEPTLPAKPSPRRGRQGERPRGRAAPAPPRGSTRKARVPLRRSKKPAA